MKTTIRAALAAALILSSLAAYAQSCVGGWAGHIDFSGVKPKDKTEKGQIDSFKKVFGNSTFKIVFRKDNSYTFTTPGFAGGKSNNEIGKWKQTGKTVIATTPKGRPQTLILSGDGKHMTNTPSPEDKMPKGIKMVFTRN